MSLLAQLLLGAISGTRAEFWTQEAKKKKKSYSLPELTGENAGAWPKAQTSLKTQLNFPAWAVSELQQNNS